jgi:hypothetical protein
MIDRLFASVQRIIVMAHEVDTVAHLRKIQSDGENLRLVENVRDIIEARHEGRGRRHQDRPLLAKLLEKRQRLALQPLIHEWPLLLIGNGIEAL